MLLPNNSSSEVCNQQKSQEWSKLMKLLIKNVNSPWKDVSHDKNEAAEIQIF